MNKGNLLVCLIFVALMAFCFVFWVLLDDARKHCESSGGNYLRSMYGYECVK